MKMNVVIVDRQPLVRMGLQELIQMDSSIQVVGEASDFKDAAELILRVQPELVITDAQLGDGSGLDLVSGMSEFGLDCKFIILTSVIDVRELNQAKMVGVNGYVWKEALPDEIMHAIRMVSKGRKYFDANIIDALMNENDGTEQLTAKEREVLIELGKGLSNKDISQRLYITEYTVKKHVSQILAKLELTDRTQAALYANVKGLVTYALN